HKVAQDFFPVISMMALWLEEQSENFAIVLHKTERLAVFILGEDAHGRRETFERAMRGAPDGERATSAESAKQRADAFDADIFDDVIVCGLIAEHGTELFGHELCAAADGEDGHADIEQSTDEKRWVFDIENLVSPAQDKPLTERGVVL